MKDRVLFHCQHSLGLGHLARSLALCAALTERFHVVLLCGGELPPGLEVPDDVDLVALPALAMGFTGALESRVAGTDVQEVKRRRRRLVLETLTSTRPRAVVVELFPFGRKKLADELVPLLEEARSLRPHRAVTVCSVRDILVSRGGDQPHHDDRASGAANRLLDAVLVHADPRFARLEDSFSPRVPLAVPVHHTGFVLARRRTPARRGGAGAGILVSAGGGAVGAPLLRAAVDAHPALWQATGLPMTVVAGPFLPEAAWDDLLAAAQRTPHVALVRWVRDLGPLLAGAVVSVSQCGYNTALEVVSARVPALVVPYAAPGEDEQTMRAAKLQLLGAVRTLPSSQLTPRHLVEAVLALVGTAPPVLDLDVDGAATSARLVAELAGHSREHSA